MGIFKAYDVRGIFGKDINEDIFCRIAKAFVVKFRLKDVVVGYDSRLTNKKLFKAVAKGITEQGVNVIDLGMVSRPMLNWVVCSKNYASGIIITASHNPRDYNGMKFMVGQRPIIYETGLNEVEKLFNENKFPEKDRDKYGEITEEDYTDDYCKFLSSNLKNKINLRIVVDACNGATGKILTRLFKIMNENGHNIKYQGLYFEPDGNFSNHDPNPLKDEAFKKLSAEILKDNADLGFMLDPDGDRVRFAGENGKILDNCYVAALLVEQYLSDRKNHGKVFVHDLVSRKILSDKINELKGKEIVSKTGFGYIYNEMFRHDGLFGSEISGHFSFREMYYLDSGIFMALKVMDYLMGKKLENNKTKISELIKPLDIYFDVGEVNIELEDKDAKMNLIEGNFKDGKVSKLDGISVEYDDAWFNIRPSNTEPLLRIRIEGRDKDTVNKLRQKILRLLED